jgi:PAS domain S-box-containing protein
MLNSQGTIVTWNRGIRELLGYEREEIVGQRGSMVFNLADQASRAFQQELATAKRDGESITERLNVHKDGSEIWVHDTATSLRNSEGILLGFAKVTRRIHFPASRDADGIELGNALAALQLEVEHRRRLEAQLLTAVEEERERLGRDLHDDLSQRLAGMALMMRALEKEIERRSPVEGRKAHVISDLLADAIGVARNLSRGLHPITLTSDGLPAALMELAERTPSGVKFKWPVSQKLNIEPSAALHIYRIAEEAIGNALKHAKADKIEITLDRVAKGKVTLAIIDNGKGFVLGTKPKGMGLQNMKYRAGIIGGTLRIIASPKRGTTVECCFPTGKSSHAR